MIDHYGEKEIREMPSPPHWSQALGVGVVTMGLAIGTGELIMWPHLVTKHGLGILWAATLGITFQYFINQEVARHALATGESFFTSSSRIFKWFAPFWLFSAVLLYVWPGWAAAMGTTLRELFGFGNYLWWAVASLSLVVVLTFIGKSAYQILEKSLKIIVPTFFILLVISSFLSLTWSDLQLALSGMFNFGYLPDDVDLAVLMGAVVFAGAGGLLNLCVSLWYRDKQIGMGKYVGRILNPITGKEEAASYRGYSFDPTPEHMARWKQWMHFIRIDQGLIFWFLGMVTLILLSVNAYAVLVPHGLVPEGLNVAVVQAHIFGDNWGPIGFSLFLVMAFLMLFSVMWTVIDAFTRIASDILYVNSHIGPFQKHLSWIKNIPLNILYYSLIVGIVLISASLLTLEQPLLLLTISAVLGGFTMAIYSPVLIYLNNFKLPRELRPGIITNLFMVSASVFYAGFTAIIFWTKVF
ncbi:MAG: Nramp family divalent metal transporter [Candidatus Paceibacterota bacterium]|jgi:Mn2+/Fe2+ NRAMP family transporter